MSAQYHDPAISEDAAGTVDVVTEVRREEALLKTGALQNAIFNSENFSSIATDEKGVIQLFNVGAERMLGYTAIEVVDKITPADISDPQEVIARAKALSRELATPITPGFEALVFKASRGIEDIYELTYIRKDGSRFPAVVSVTALRDDLGGIIGYLLIGTDNTARKQIEAEQKQLDQRLRDQQFYTRSLIESNIDALMTTDPAGIITDLNKQMEALTGCTRDELIGAPFKNYFTDPERAEAAIKRVLSGSKVTDYELTARARDGKETVVSYNATTFRDRDRKLQGVFAAARDVTERKRFERMLQKNNEELITVNDELQAKNAALAQARDFAMSIVETVRQPLLVLDTDLRIRMANRAFYRTFQASPLEAEGEVIYSLSRGSWDIPGLRDSLDGLLQDGNSFPDLEVEQDFPSIGRRSLVLGGCRINYLKMILLAVDDITERKLAQQDLHKSEEHLRQSQKMEFVGRLAGGIAHDFNNLLTGIIGYSSLLYERLAGDEVAIQQVLQIRTASERAATLTQQLLAVSRRQVLQPKVLDLNAIVADFDGMLRHLVGERIKVVVDCEPALWQVRADPGEIGRAIMNLSLNARDAMPEGGTLTIQTANVTVTGADAPNQELAQGRYVMMAVHDTGVGIDAEVRAQIFEPFFTTKEIGKGTGLGLATVLGIVEQSSGVIRCESDPGRGTTFTIFLPAVDETVDKGPRPAGGLAEAPKGSEVILLVEDEDMLRVLARTILEKSGYVVYEARNGQEGLALCKSHEGTIDLLVCDVVMPELGGRELAEGALRLRPGMKVMFMSGHTQDVLLKEGVQKGTAFLQKPFTPVGLAQKVRETLDSEARSVGQP